MKDLSRFSLFLALAALMAAGCQKNGSAASKTPGAEAPPDPAQSRRLSPPTAPPPAPSVSEIGLAPQSSEPIAQVVRQELTRAATDGYQLVVYVGATWCEPCQRFHQAVEAGELNKTFPGIRFLEFDSDTDGERLAQAGYKSRFIPLFSVPGPDGRDQGRRSAGAIKGPGAVDYIVPRLRRILASP